MGGLSFSVMTEEKGRSSCDVSSLGPHPSRLPLLTELAVTLSDVSLNTNIWFKSGSGCWEQFSITLRPDGSHHSRSGTRARPLSLQDSRFEPFPGHQPEHLWSRRKWEQ